MQGLSERESPVCETNYASHDFKQNVIQGSWVNLGLEPRTHLLHSDIWSIRTEGERVEGGASKKEKLPRNNSTFQEP